MIQQVGMLIARGALISVIEIFFVLPLLFTGGDWLVRHASYKIGFFEGPDDAKSDGSEPLPTSA